MKFFISLFIALFSFTAFAQGDSQAPSFLETILRYIDLVAKLCFGVMIVATLVTRLIPGEKDDEVVESVSTKVQKWINYLPTFGINPRTKKLEDALKQVKEKEKKPIDSAQAETKS